MKKLAVALLLFVSLSNYAKAILGKSCSGANVSEQNLGTVMALLHKNGLKYTVTKNKDAYRVVVKAPNGIEYINKKLRSLQQSEIMKELGVDFNRTTEGECIEQKEVEDLSLL